jgi:hypothetical protein
MPLSMSVEMILVEIVSGSWMDKCANNRLSERNGAGDLIGRSGLGYTLSIYIPEFFTEKGSFRRRPALALARSFARC